MSKSAMQELRDDILIELKLGFISEHSAVRILNYIDGIYIEKEKQQIIDAYEGGYNACDLDEALEINKRLTSGERYYDINFNQNK